jgi:hypothetical protein
MEDDTLFEREVEDEAVSEWLVIKPYEGFLKWGIPLDHLFSTDFPL